MDSVSPNTSTVLVKSVSAVAAFVGVWSGILYMYASGLLGTSDQKKVSLNSLYDKFIPGLAATALLMTLVLGIRAVVKKMENTNPLLEKFGQKCFIATAASILFAFSCFYRAMNIADEGAFTCRGEPTAFNAPAAGRFVATIGEIALIVQTAVYIRATAKRLGAKPTTWRKLCERLTTIKFTTIVPVLLAETCSWSGLLSANPKFFCAEYILWMIIALTWVWDGGTLLNNSSRFTDQVAHAGLLCAGLGLFCFNAFVEIPHFFAYDRSADKGSGQGGPPKHVTVFECSQDADSPLWVKRLPFFVCYFIGCSWASTALAYRLLSRKSRPHAE